MSGLGKAMMRGAGRLLVLDPKMQREMSRRDPAQGMDSWTGYGRTRDGDGAEVETEVVEVVEVELVDEALEDACHATWCGHPCVRGRHDGWIHRCECGMSYVQ